MSDSIRVVVQRSAGQPSVLRALAPLHGRNRAYHSERAEKLRSALGHSRAASEHLVLGTLPDGRWAMAGLTEAGYELAFESVPRNVPGPFKLAKPFRPYTVSEALQFLKNCFPGAIIQVADDTSAGKPLHSRQERLRLRRKLLMEIRATRRNGMNN